MRYLPVGLIFIILITCCSPKSSNKTDLTEKWSVRMADAVMQRFDSLISYNNPDRINWQYDIAMLGQAIDKLGYLDARYSRYHEDFIDYFIDEDGDILTYDIEEYNLDNVNPAKGLITQYKRKGDTKYLNAINTIIVQLQNQPKTHAGGYWHKLRYPWQMWLDGIYMSSPFLAQYAKEFNKPEWFDTISRQITLIYSKTYDPATGLLYHAWDESKTQRWCNPQTGQSRHFWGRAMGWYMMALVDVLEYMPSDYPQRDSILTILNHTSEALLNARDSETGLWYQVLDKQGEEGNYLEASCSSMFTYAFAKGAKKGFLPEKFHDISEECFNSVLKNFIFTDENGLPVMTNICGSAGLGGDPYRDGSYEYYINEKKVDNDPKGIAPFIMASIELGR
ncbi:MAG: glycoside hydrolase family 88 protein [Bacteroidales bacterium]|nr:glycoside hydrolase family 88 protein [Bacteroidales bacterium]